MSEILLGSHVGMSGKEMFLGSVKEAAEYGANALMVYTGAPQNTRRKEIGELRLDEGLAYAEKAGIREIIIHAPYIINLGNMEKPEMFDFGVDFLAKEVKRTAAFHRKCGSFRAALPGQSQALIPCIILKSMRAKFFCRMENSQHICMRSRSIETYGKNMIQTRMTISFLNCCSPRRHRSSLDLNWMK